MRVFVSIGPRDNRTVRKSDEHTKTPSWFVNTKVYSQLHFLSSLREEQKHSMKDKEKQHAMKRERERERERRE